ncbi:glutathione S-transferase family protein [Agrobacterium vitis]|uniref:Glutathione S-transferase family protein n=1 Tax=Agrobacterium vitis TaxID=373 RepID=A0A6I4GZU6_AGRVI|nr:glutathione S-transferase family protein [Agrobacterium vitis]MVA59601.1 glutathione S-transferase family protein [Agrobacterium vitis]MVA82656.1 glutathione S-transferase family protein [Agrobacterium vitis]
MTTLYGDVSKTRANRCSWMLKELGIEYANEPFSFRPGEAKPAEFLALNPNGKCPTLVDDGFVLFESLAINLYLAKKYGGPLAPQSLEEDALATQWSLWAATEIEKPLLLASALRYLFEPQSENPEELEIALRKLSRPWGVLDRHLQERQFILGDRFTVADINVAAVLHFIPIAAIDISFWPAMARWLEACLARPAAVDARSVRFRVPRPATPRDIVAMFV